MPAIPTLALTTMALTTPPITRRHDGWHGRWERARARSRLAARRSGRPGTGFPPGRDPFPRRPAHRRLERSDPRRRRSPVGGRGRRAEPRGRHWRPLRGRARAADDHRARARDPLCHRSGRGQLPGGALPGRCRRRRRRLRDGHAGETGPAASCRLAEIPGHHHPGRVITVPAGDRWRGRTSGPVVRPYAVTGGRTEPAEGEVLDLIAVVVATGLPPAPEAERSSPEHRRLLALCEQQVTVADLAADTELPVGVVRVLIADLTQQGAVPVVRQRPTDKRSEKNVLQEILDGLRAL